jgi:nucleotide-binding universal stress UspA family protein
MASIQIERILCPVDFSEVSAKAYRYAQSIACQYRAELILQHVVELWQHPSADYAVKPESFDSFRQTLVSAAAVQLRQFAASYGGVQPECVVQESTAANAILSLAQARTVSLITMGTHGRSGFDHLMLGSVTERVLRHAPCPVLAIPGNPPDESAKTSSGDSVPVQRILCCVDFSAHSERALDHALSVAEAYGAGLTVLHVLDHVSESMDVGKETQAVMDNLQKLVAPSALAPARIHLEVRLGTAYREILNLAADQWTDLIVTGVRGRNSLDVAVLGSTTYRVIQLYPGPVLAVPI